MPTATATAFLRSLTLSFWKPWAVRVRSKQCRSLFLTPSKHYSSSALEYRHKDLIESGDENVFKIISEDMKVYPDFITKDEENSLLEEVEKSMKRLRYEFNHWDEAIHGYREREQKNWNEANMQIINKVLQIAFTDQDSPLAYIHILDLAKDGYIKPHIDAVRFCGDTIAGISLMSSCVMRLALESDKEMFANIHIPQRGLYIMKNRARYEFTHEVLKDDESFFHGNHIPRNRRISVICRNEPRHQDTL